MKKLLIPAALILASGLAVAGSESAPDFAELDVNADGVLSQEEAAMVEGLDFSAADQDQDGSLNEEEYKAAMKKE